MEPRRLISNAELALRHTCLGADAGEFADNLGPSNLAFPFVANLGTSGRLDRRKIHARAVDPAVFDPKILRKIGIANAQPIRRGVMNDGNLERTDRESVRVQKV